MGGGGFASDAILPGDSATYCAVVVGDFVYGICPSDLHGEGEGTKSQGTLAAFRAKRTLGCFVSRLVVVSVGEPCAALQRLCGLVSGVNPCNT